MYTYVCTARTRPCKTVVYTYTRVHRRTHHVDDRVSAVYMSRVHDTAVYTGRHGPYMAVYTAVIRSCTGRLHGRKRVHGRVHGRITVVYTDVYTFSAV